MDHASPEELKSILGPMAQGEARRLRSGESIANFKVKIHVRLGQTGRNQSLEVQHPGGRLAGIRVSGGKGGASNPIRRQCFVPNTSSHKLLRSAAYNNSPMYDPLMFMGRGNNEAGWVFGIHGTDAEGLLGNEASKGCIRVSKADAVKIRGIVNANGGAESAVICID